MQYILNIRGMTCSACSTHVEKAANTIDGVQKARVNLLQNRLIIDVNPAVFAISSLVAAIEKAGYGVTSIQNPADQRNSAAANPSTSAAPAMDNPSAQENDEYLRLKKRLKQSLIFFFPLFYLSMGAMIGLPLPSFLKIETYALRTALLQFYLTVPILWINRAFFSIGWKRLKQKQPSMDSLVALGAGAAVIYGAWLLLDLAGQNHGHTAHHAYHSLSFESAGTILTLITLGKTLEARAKHLTLTSMQQLLDLAPPTACKRNGDQEEIVDVSSIQAGDILILKAGSKVPVDGQLLEGNLSLDESALTGESLPVEKKAGDKVFTASLCRSGWAKMEAQAVGQDTTLAQMAKLMEEANQEKAPIARLADRISAVFVPVVLVIALITLGAWLIFGSSLETALTHSIAVLVIACPCAMGLATPAAIMAGTGKGAKLGILIKSPVALEDAHRLEHIVFDKTGTLTVGEPSVQTLYVPTSYSEEDLQEIIALAALLETPSEHPLAKAIVQLAAKRQAPRLGLQPQNFQATPGEGIRGDFEGETYFIGNHKMVQQIDLNLSPEEKRAATLLADAGQTALFLCSKEQILAIFGIADQIKPSAKPALQALRKQKIRPFLLTGDNRRTALAVGRELEFAADEIFAEVLPTEKEAFIREQSRTSSCLAMVGDGINDAPSLARADIGIALGAGTQIALEAADIILMHNQVSDVVTTIRLSRRVMRTIKQNLFWAMFYNLIGIPLAAGLLIPVLGFSMPPMFAAAAMSLSSIFVVGNALRLRYFTAKSQFVDNAAQPSTEPVELKIKRFSS